MALYEGIALIQEKQAVVLDVGSDYTKFGFAGEAAPRCIVRSEFWDPSERRYKRVYDYKTEEELYDNLVQFLHMLYFRHVLVNPKERRVVVVESLLTPTLFRETLAKVLYLHLEVCGVVWADGGRCAALVCGLPSALLVSAGSADTELCAVVHGVPIIRALQQTGVGARALRNKLKEIIVEENGDVNITDQELEDIFVKTCFVASREKALQWVDSAPQVKDVTWPRPHDKPLKISGRARVAPAELLFVRDNDMDSLPDLVLKCVMLCPIDARVPLCENILVHGGLAALPGLRARLHSELRALREGPAYCERLFVRTFKQHPAPTHDNSIAWCGGAILGAACAAGGRATPREQYLRTRRLPDWPAVDNHSPSA